MLDDDLGREESLTLSTRAETAQALPERGFDTNSRAASISGVPVFVCEARKTDPPRACITRSVVMRSMRCFSREECNSRYPPLTPCATRALGYSLKGAIKRDDLHGHCDFQLGSSSLVGPLTST